VASLGAMTPRQPEDPSRRHEDLPSGVGRFAWLRISAVCVVAVAIGAATTSGPVYVAPSAFAIVAGAAAVAVALVAEGRLAPWIAAGAAAFAGAAAGHLLARAGMPRVHDVLHLWGVWAYGRCVAEGSYWPLWTPYLGAGMPLLPFYGALNFLLALPGILMGLAPMGAWKLEMFLGHVLAALSLLGAARILGAGWGASALAAAAGAFAPWRLAVFGYRGSLGEANAFLFMPLTAAAALRLLRGASPAAAVVLVLGMTGLLLTHPISLFTLAIALVPAGAVWVATSDGPRHWDRALPLGLALAAAVGISAALWLPVVAEQRYTSVRATTADNPFYRYEEQGVPTSSLLARREWDRLRIAIPETTRRERGLEREQMPYYAGAALLLLGLTAGWWSQRKEAWALSAGALLAVALATSPAAHLLGGLPPFPTLRFPWRFLSPASVLCALAIGLGADAWLRSHAGRRWAIPLGLALAVLAWDGAPYTGAADRIPPYDGTVHWWERQPGATHWDASREPVPVRLPEGDVVLRVFNLELPPSDYRTPIDSFFPGYYEWLTPEVYRRYWSARDMTTLGEAGVRLHFAAGRRDPVEIRALPYASLERPGGAPLAITPGSVTRRPGRITVEARVPEEGATLLLREQAFPGWTARLDGSTRREPRSERGFIAVDLPPGAHHVELAYGFGTPARRAGLALSGITLAILAIVTFLRRRRTASART
jgi:hypothetical protein